MVSGCPALTIPWNGQWVLGTDHFLDCWRLSGLLEAFWTASGLLEAFWRTSGLLEALWRTSGLLEAFWTAGLLLDCWKLCSPTVFLLAVQKWCIPALFTYIPSLSQHVLACIPALLAVRVYTAFQHCLRAFQLLSSTLCVHFNYFRALLSSTHAHA